MFIVPDNSTRDGNFRNVLSANVIFRELLRDTESSGDRVDGHVALRLLRRHVFEEARGHRVVAISRGSTHAHVNRDRAVAECVFDERVAVDEREPLLLASAAAMQLRNDEQRGCIKCRPKYKPSHRASQAREPECATRTKQCVIFLTVFSPRAAWREVADKYSRHVCGIRGAS